MVTPLELRGQLLIHVRADEDYLMNPVITSPTSGEHAELSPDRHEIKIYVMPVELNIPLTVTVTIEVTPKVSAVEFTPYVWIGWREIIDSGTESGSSVSSVVEELGTLTCYAQGDYVWKWEESLSYAWRWHAHSRGIVEANNKVSVMFNRSWSYYVGGDTFSNREVTGTKHWFTALLNTPDDTGMPVAGLGLTLASQLEADNYWSESLERKGPPIWEWFFGDIPEQLAVVGQTDIEAFIESSDGFPATWTPGFDLSRTLDKTEFSETDTQTLTIEVTPRDKKIERIGIGIHTISGTTLDFVEDAIITSPTSGEYIEVLTPDGHTLYTTLIPVELNVPWSITLTIRVIPKVPKVEYVPYVSIGWGGPYDLRTVDQGTTKGSFLSYTMAEAGTWNWSAEGNYVWDWEYKSIFYTVGLNSTALTAE